MIYEPLISLHLVFLLSQRFSFLHKLLPRITRKLKFSAATPISISTLRASNSLIKECNILAGGTCPLTFAVRPGFNGWTASGQYNLSRWLGVEANVSGTYGNIVTAKIAIPLPIPPLNLSIPDQHIYDFLFGPVISRRAHSYTVFAHGLIGGEHVGSGNFALAPIPIAVPPPSFSETDFAFALGGGLDIRITRHFSVRAGQFDYQFVSSSGNGHQNDFRFSSGIVFGFGGK
jgi:hypothetical protein